MSATAFTFSVEKIHKKLIQETSTLILKSASATKATQSSKIKSMKIIMSASVVFTQAIKVESFRKEKACKKKKKLQISKTEVILCSSAY